MVNTFFYVPLPSRCLLLFLVSDLQSHQQMFDYLDSSYFPDMHQLISVLINNLITSSLRTAPVTVWHGHDVFAQGPAS